MCVFVWVGSRGLDLRWPQVSCCGCPEPAGLGGRSSSTHGWLIHSPSMQQTVLLVRPIGPSGMQRVSLCSPHSQVHLCPQQLTQGAGERF